MNNKFTITRFGGQVIVADVLTGITVKPDCGQDMVLLHSYFLGRGRDMQATHLLEAVVEGKLPVTELTIQASKEFPKKVSL